MAYTAEQQKARYYANLEENRRKHREYARKNREKVNEQRRALRARDGDRIREAEREYKRGKPRSTRPPAVPQTPEQRREYMREYQRAWRARNPEKAKQITRKSRDLNRSKHNERKRARRAADPDKYRKQDRAQRAKDPGRNQHGRWIKQDRATMWAAQDGKCYLCGEPMDNPRVIRIDHDHSCCAPNTSCRICRRGLVHHRCNIAIGYVGDDPALLRRMADALEVAQLAFRQRREASGAGEQLTLG